MERRGGLSTMGGFYDGDEDSGSGFMSGLVISYGRSIVAARWNIE